MLQMYEMELVDVNYIPIKGFVFTLLTWKVVSPAVKKRLCIMVSSYCKCIVVVGCT